MTQGRRRAAVAALAVAAGTLTALVPTAASAAPVGALGSPRMTTDIERAVVDLTNAARAVARNCGDTYYPAVGPLTVNETLASVALAHSTDMAVRGFFSHDNPDGLGPFQRMAAAGYQYTSAGENIAAGYPTPADVVAGWLNSPGHCRNIMNPSFTEIGVGFYQAETLYHEYWSQEFGAHSVEWSVASTPAATTPEPVETAQQTQAIAAAQPQAAPAGTEVRLLKVTRSAGKVGWTEVEAADGYQVRIIKPSGASKWITTTALTRKFSGLRHHRNYTVQVAPVLESGPGQVASLEFVTK